MRPHERRRLARLLAAPLGAVLFVLLWTSISFAQGMGLWQVGPSIPGRSVCTAITNPVTSMTWCFDGNTNPGVLKVWNGVVYVTVGGGGGSASLPWIDISQDPYNAVCDGVSNSRAAIQLALNSLTTGGALIIPKGNCMVDSTGLTYSGTGALQILGLGPGVSTIGTLASGATFNVFTLTNTGKVTFRDVSLNLTNTPNSTGVFRAPTSVTENATFMENVAITNGDTAVNIDTNAWQNKFHGVTFVGQGTRNLRLNNTANPDAGDNEVIGGQFECACTDGILVTVGGLRVQGAKFIGGQQYAIHGIYTASAGLNIIGNDFAAYTQAAISLSGLYSNIEIAGNSMGGGGGAPTVGVQITGLTDVNSIARITITGNVFQATDTGDQSIQLTKASIITVSGNTTHGFLNSKWMVLDTVNDANISGNMWLLTNSSLAYAVATIAAVTINDDNGITFANLPSGLANGSRIYCTDCKVSLTTGQATSGGTGMIATRLNGAWYGFDATGNLVATTSLNLPFLVDGCLQVSSGITVSTGVACGSGGGGGGTVTSVAASGSGIFSWTGSPITTAGTLGLVATGTSGGIPYFSAGTTLTSSAALTNHAVVIGGGAGAAPKTVAAMTNGQLLIGSTGADPVPASLTAGTNVTLTPGAGSLQIDVAGSGISGSGAATRCTYWSGAAAITSDSLCNWDATNHTLVLGATSSTSGVKLEVRAGKTILSQNTGTLPSVGSALYVAEADGTGAQALLDSFGAASSSFLLRRADTSLAAPSALQTNDKIGNLGFRGYFTGGSSGYSTDQAEFACWAAGNWSDTSRPTFCTVATTPSGSTTPLEALRLDSTQSIVTGTWKATAVGSQWGGTGINSSASTGVPSVSSGTWSVNATLGVALGGTNIASYAVGDLLYASGATTLSKLADVAAGSFLRSGGVTTAPAWSTTLWTNSATTGDLLAASATNTYSNIAAVAVGQTLISKGTGTLPAWSGSLGLNVAAPATAGTVAATAGANNVTMLLLKRNTDTSPLGKFNDYQNAAGTSVYSVEITGAISGKGLTLSDGAGSGDQCMQVDNTGLVTFTGSACGSSGGAGVTSVALTMPAVFSVSGSPITTAGTLAVSAAGTSGGIPYFASASTMGSSAALTQHAVMAGGGAGNTPYTLTAQTNGQLLIGSTGADPVAAALTQGANITITNGAGSITIAADNSIKSLQSQTGATQTFATVNDTNVTITEGSAANVHTFTAGWAGTLSTARGGWGQSMAAATGIPTFSSGTLSFMTGTAARIPFYSNSTTLSTDTGLQWDNSAKQFIVAGTASFTAAVANPAFTNKPWVLSTTTSGARPTTNPCPPTCGATWYDVIQYVSPMGMYVTTTDASSGASTNDGNGVGIGSLFVLRETSPTSTGTYANMGLAYYITSTAVAGSSEKAGILNTIYATSNAAYSTYLYNGFILRLKGTTAVNGQYAYYMEVNNQESDYALNGYWIAQSATDPDATHVLKTAGAAFLVTTDTGDSRATAESEAWRDILVAGPQVHANTAKTFPFGQPRLRLDNTGRVLVAPNTYSTTGTISNASAVITGIPSTSGIRAGMAITGDKIPDSTKVNSVDSGTQITMSAAATGAGTSFVYGPGAATQAVAEVDIITETVTNTRGLAVRQYVNDATSNSPALLTLYRGQGTSFTPSALSSTSQIGALAFSGYDGTTGWSTSQINVGAVFGAVSNEATGWSNARHGAYLTMQMAKDGTTTLQEYFRFTGNGTSTTDTNLKNFAYGTGAHPYPSFTGMRGRGSYGSVTAVGTGDTLAAFEGYGATASNTYSTAGRAGMLAVANETWTVSANGAYLLFAATPNGGTATATVATMQSGIQVGSPTGGDKGAGTINAASNIYINNVAVGTLSAVTNGTGISVSSGSGPTATITNTGVTSITGTANQVIASASTGAVTLSLPQSIATTSNVQFRSIIAQQTSGSDETFNLKDTGGTAFMRVLSDHTLVMTVYGGSGNRTVCVNNAGLFYTVASGVAC